MDIIGNREEPVGYLADDEETYREFIVRAITKYDS